MYYSERAMSEGVGIRKVMVVVLVALFLAQLGGGLYDVLFSNYLIAIP